MARALLIVVAIGLAAVLYGALIERNWFALRSHRVPCLPSGMHPIRVLHISDLHLRRAQRRKQRFLRGLARVQPDLVIGTGDFLGDATSVEATVEAMSVVRGDAPGLFVLGSNDYYGPKLKNPARYLKRERGPHIAGAPNPWEDLVDGLRARGWTFLNNAASTLDGIEIVGLDDAHIGRADLRVATARAHEGFRLAIAHSPDVARDLADLGYDLIVCGHTHGGQLRVPGFGALVTNSTLPRAMARGVHTLGGAWLHVSAGLGTSMFSPVRFACRPEACVLELVPREASR